MLEKLMTPKSLLTSTAFEKPEVISPLNCNSFFHLLRRREDIQNLRLVPIKSDEERALYKVESAEATDSIVKILQHKKIFYEENKYPYFLPSDVVQGIIWINEDDEKKVIDFIELLMEILDVKEDAVILFERPQNTSATLVRGTIPHIRHIHIWTEKNDIATL